MRTRRSRAWRDLVASVEHRAEALGREEEVLAAEPEQLDLDPASIPAPPAPPRPGCGCGRPGGV